MIPTLYDKTGNNKIGVLSDCIECLVEEERNGIFELTMIYPANSSILESIVYDNIIVADANDYLKSQKFRVYNTRKLMANRIEVCARHISFDLVHDWVDVISIENQSCEYALNTIFRNSQFSKHFKGHSDIVNAQNFKVNKVTCLEAIGGTDGSIIDTYGTGAEILRDNTDIHVLNRRGHDNDVTIEYRKNLTGLEVEEDTTDLVTRIMPYAIYTNSNNEEVEVRGDFVNSPLINNYAHPYVKYMDYSEEFEDGEVPTKTKLNNLATKEYTINKVDIPKCNFKIEFIPLSKCAGYEGLEDRINLCDVVTVKDSRYNIDTQAKVIKVVFDVLRGRYDSMELGEPRTTLGDIIGGTGDGPTQGPPGPPGPQGPAGADGSIGDFPESLPTVPQITAKVYGFANIELSWTFENKVYYSYELYASKTKGFTPNTFNLVFSGQASTYLYQAEPNETWYFKACALNTHGQRTEFSEEVEASTVKISDLSNYVESAAIGDALIGELNLGRGWYGELRGNYIDARQMSVTDGNGKRTLDIDSFGNVNADLSSLKLKGEDVNSLYTNKTEFNQTATKLELLASSSKRNILNNSNGLDGEAWWGKSNANLEIRTVITHPELKKGFALVNATNLGLRMSQEVPLNAGQTYTFQITCEEVQLNCISGFRVTLQDGNNVVYEMVSNGREGIHRYNFTPTKTSYYTIGIWHNGASKLDGSLIKLSDLLLVKGYYTVDLEWNDSTEDNASISIKANQIVNKVSTDDFSSLIEQNAKSVEVAFNAITDNVQNSEGRFIVRNGAIELYNADNQNVFNIGNDGWINVWGLKVFGTNNPIVFTGDGDKGIEINAQKSNIAYIDFSRGDVDDYTARIAQLPDNGTLLSVIGGLEVLPDVRQASDARLELRSPVAGPSYIDFAHSANEDYQKRIVSYNNDPQLHILGGLTIDGPRLLVDRIGRNTNPITSSIYFENNVDFQGKTIYNAVIPLTADYTYPSEFLFAKTDSHLATGDIIDNIIFKEKVGEDRVLRLSMDLTNVLDTDSAVMDSSGEAYGDVENLLKLALKEIQDLRVRVSDLECKLDN